MHAFPILRTLTTYVEGGKIRPVVDARHFTLDTAIAAHYAQESQEAGSANVKIVIDVA